MLGHVGERLVDHEVGGALDGRRGPGGDLHVGVTGTGERATTADNAASSPRSSRITGWMPRTRSRISLSADFASSCASARSRRPSSGSTSIFSSAAPIRRRERRGAAAHRRGGHARSAGARPRRCQRRRCGWSPAAGPGRREQHRRSGRAGRGGATRRRVTPTVTHGATNTSPRRPTADAPGAPAPWVISKKWNFADPRQTIDVQRQHQHRQRAAPRRHRQGEADGGDRQVARPVVGDLLSPRRATSPAP